MGQGRHWREVARCLGGPAGGSEARTSVSPFLNAGVLVSAAASVVSCVVKTRGSSRTSTRRAGALFNPPPPPRAGLAKGPRPMVRFWIHLAHFRPGGGPRLAAWPPALLFRTSETGAPSQEAVASVTESRNGLPGSSPGAFAAPRSDAQSLAPPSCDGVSGWPEVAPLRARDGRPGFSCAFEALVGAPGLAAVRLRFWKPVNLARSQYSALRPPY